MFQITSEMVLQITDMYKNSLHTFGHELLPRFPPKKSFHLRSDSLLLLLARRCPNLKNLVIREQVSTATVLLLAQNAQNLRQFYVRRNAVILRCDWPKNPDWSDAFFKRLQKSSRSYEQTETEVSLILGRKWKMLSDKSFKLIKNSINVRDCEFN